jgi:glycosyltransferase involved in cell wall biosynthesis
LLSVVDDVRIVQLAILRKASLKSLKLKDIDTFIKRFVEARRMMCSYDITYINTILVFDYALASSIVRRPRIMHAHEIPTGAAKLFFLSLVILSRAFMIFNSEATQRSFKLPFWQRGVVVWNGSSGPSNPPSPCEHIELRLLLIGRFNSWKGQEVLLRAAASLTADQRSRLKVRLVGSVFGDQEHFADRVRRVIAEEGIAEMVEMCPFTPDPFEHYRWADVVVVPSVKPEPFGLVAIEAMATSRCVIAANHGGLREIVVDGVTGTLVEPGSIESLAVAIRGYLDNRARVVSEGEAGQRRFIAEFDEKHYKRKIRDIVADLCKTHAT